MSKVSCQKQEQIWVWQNGHHLQGVKIVFLIYKRLLLPDNGTFIYFHVFIKKECNTLWYDKANEESIIFTLCIQLNSPDLDLFSFIILTHHLFQNV